MIDLENRGVRHIHLHLSIGAPTYHRNMQTNTTHSAPFVFTAPMIRMSRRVNVEATVPIIHVIRCLIVSMKKNADGWKAA